MASRRHRPALAFLQPLIERGQHTSTFRPDVPPEWHLCILLAIIHTASGELQANRLPPEDMESALMTTVLGALGAGGRAYPANRLGD